MYIVKLLNSTSSVDVDESYPMERMLLDATGTLCIGLTSSRVLGNRCKCDVLFSGGSRLNLPRFRGSPNQGAKPEPEEESPSFGICPTSDVCGALPR